MTTPKQRAVDSFNRTYPIGTPVTYWPGSLEDPGITSKTRSEAWLLSGHTPVVQVEGDSTCVALSHVKPAAEELI